MKLHANAALSWSGGRLLVERVLVEGMSLVCDARVRLVDALAELDTPDL